MKLKQVLLAAAVSFAGAVAISGGASAATIYDNGPLNGNTDGFTINNGFAVEDSFTVSNATTATGADFVTWNSSDDAITSVDWVIESAQAFGTSGTAKVTSTLLVSGNAYGYDIYSNHISFGGVALTAGTYYFGLQNAVAPGNADSVGVFWDQNDGPSTAYGSGFGGIINTQTFGGSCNGACTYSETFDITGGAGGVPEPATWALMLVGFGGMGAAMRSARRKSGATATA